jgi:hypothetical protein
VRKNRFAELDRHILDGTEDIHTIIEDGTHHPPKDKDSPKKEA